MGLLLRAIGLCCVVGMMTTATTSVAADPLQCVPYARTVSGVALRGDARTWWDRAEGRYDRGRAPRRGAVMAFAPFGPMTLGHVAVVSQVLDDREILIRHANWSTPGAIEEDVRAVDVSPANDWSAVRVWHSPTGQMGARTNPVLGFIYSSTTRLRRFEPERDANGASYAVLRKEMVSPAVIEVPRLKANFTAIDSDAPSRPNRVFLAYRGTGNTLSHTPATAQGYHGRIFVIENGAAPKIASPVRSAQTEPRRATAKRGDKRSLADIIADVKRSAKIG